MPLMPQTPTEITEIREVTDCFCMSPFRVRRKVAHCLDVPGGHGSCDREGYRSLITYTMEMVIETTTDDPLQD